MCDDIIHSSTRSPSPSVVGNYLHIIIICREGVSSLCMFRNIPYGHTENSIRNSRIIRKVLEGGFFKLNTPLDVSNCASVGSFHC